MIARRNRKESFSAVRTHQLLAALVLVVCISMPSSGGAAPLAEYVTYKTEDGLALQALLWQPTKPTDTLLIWVPGMTGGFVGPWNLNAIASNVINKGYAYMAVNTRTAGLHGMLFALFEDYAKDVDAAVGYAKSRGFTNVVLIGHSLGGCRIVYYWAQKKDPVVRALVFSASIKSPYLEAQIRWNEKERAQYDTFLQKARDLVATGRGNDVLTYQWSANPLTLSAKSFVNMFGTLDESNASTVKFCPQVTIPAVVISFTKDRLALPPNAEAIYASLTASPMKELVWIEGEDHFVGQPQTAERYSQVLLDGLAKVKALTGAKGGTPLNK